MHEPVSEEEMFIIEKQKVILKDFDSSGVVLDLGGGGEGIISVLKDEVIAIDMRKEELEEAPEGPLKVVMDARNLQFLDETFETVTSFFTLMFIKRSDRKKVFEEVYRVLKPGGKFLVWDVVIPPSETDREWFVVPVAVEVQNEKIETGYGVRWEGSEQDAKYYTGLAEEGGFEIVEKEERDQNFFLHLKKSNS